MSKVIGPLLSFGASGQVGKSAVFGTWRGVQYARRYVIPANPDTAAQQTQRGSFATMREIWKRIGTLSRAPWDAYASGRRFLGLNAFIGENRLSIGTDPDMSNFIGSPGARGGIPLVAMAAASAVAQGGIDVDFTVPAVPAGWTLQATVVMAFVQQAPTAVFPGGAVEAEVLVAPWDHALVGLTPGATYVVSGWARYVKPDGSIAYSPSITDTAVATA